MKSDRKRSKLFVDKKVQGVLLKQLVFHWFTAALVMVLFLLIMQVLSTPERLSLGEHAGQMWSKYGILLVAIAAIMPVFIYDSIKLSHRFAGPMVSYRNAMAKLAKGEPINAVGFRNKDFWHEICNDLNAVAKRMDLLSESTGNSDKPAAS